MNNNVAIVTGAARGIGLATCTLLSKQGWTVAMIDRDASELDSVVGSIENALAINCDVSVPEQVEQMVSTVTREFGGIDVLVNNAGVADFGPIADTTFDRWRRVMATNLDGVFLCSQACIPALTERQGAIVNIASISGLRARVNCVAPGPVKTKLSIAVHTPEIITAYHDAIPLNRYGSEMEIANTIVFLCSQEASYITGQTIAVDGGFESTGVGLPALRTTE